MTSRTRRRADAVRNEREHLPDPGDVAELAELRRRLLEAGHAPATVHGIVGWLVGQAAGDDDVTGAATRARYRKVLAELPPAAGRRPLRYLSVVA